MEIIEQFKRDLICQVMLENKQLEHRANLNLSDAKKISIEIIYHKRHKNIIIFQRYNKN
jgi:hypothetical protein